ncbi:hypothetical protein TCAL_00603 [Tigriopus californicus]|uniref:Gamma-glutamylcyclotransferase family protein n=1 Tax=Tigriopus californicus TaxID=6832 RepID=A0A553PBN9_TIGCA|nr:putative gamma-glutamylcyclotransferase CG2811 [Tigriopus californicus]TRY75094.1 hypothetical protein TCAL_00603 [Tigriopus californicus]|eukprot:TCALIF_00603-PA protein Name:"Similar to CG2811 Putative gamma-glutamylcyclotransferase CG2811 (Drosophila melanogaster)" AED:0.13 eAED:0.13 QI:7/0.5/0.33/0.66/1/0.66/3/0/189
MKLSMVRAKSPKSLKVKRDGGLKMALKCPHLVFVYGSLKRQQPNHEAWLANPDKGQAVFHAQGQTVKAFPLIVASRYNIPYLLDAPGMGRRVQGEVFAVNDLMLQNLDIMEDVPAFYSRGRASVELTDKSLIECWLYTLPDYKEELLQNECLANYASEELPLTPFVPRALRSTTDFYWEVKKTARKPDS